jgi:hypothetical protein
VRSIRAGKGLGDSLYLQAVTRHFLLKGERLQVKTNWPDVFRQLDVECVPFDRKADICAHYSMRKREATNQFQDCCLQAGIAEPVDFRLDWAPTTALPYRPYVCVLLPRTPMDRADNYGIELLPEREAMQACIDVLRQRFTIVQVGRGEPVYGLERIDVDLTGKTTVAELLDVASGAAGFLGYCSFFVPLAESLNKPALFVWAARGLASDEFYIRSITPQKILSRESSRYVIDDWPEERILAAADAFLR